jgi:hypothetical protein
MKPPPLKPDSQRMPFNAPPSAQSLASRGLALMRTKRAFRGEDGPTALLRAKSMPWGGRIVREEPYMASEFWLWIVKEAA